MCHRQKRERERAKIVIPTKKIITWLLFLISGIGHFFAQNIFSPSTLKVNSKWLSPKVLDFLIFSIAFHDRRNYFWTKNLYPKQQNRKLKKFNSYQKWERVLKILKMLPNNGNNFNFNYHKMSSFQVTVFVQKKLITNIAILFWRKIEKRVSLSRLIDLSFFLLFLSCLLILLIKQQKLRTNRREAQNQITKL